MELREAIGRASAHFLTEPLPPTWPELSHGEVLGFVETNKAHFVICKDASVVYKQIELLAETFMEIANGKA